MTIYFIEMEGEGWIKIGYTAGSPEKRMAQLQTGQPQRLKLLGTISGERDAERGLHDEFKEFRIGGEWFHPSSFLMRAIRDLINNQLLWFHCRKWRIFEDAWEQAFKNSNIQESDVPQIEEEHAAFPHEAIAQRKKVVERLRALAKKTGGTPEWLRKRFAEESTKIRLIKEEWAKNSSPMMLYVLAWEDNAASHTSIGLGSRA